MGGEDLEACKDNKPCDTHKPTWFCKRDKVSKSHYPTCKEINYNALCCIPAEASMAKSKYGHSTCGKSRCKVGGPGVVDSSLCEQPEPPKIAAADEEFNECVAEKRRQKYK